MNEIIQSLEANATNGEENFCYISENKLNALKELSKRERQENQKYKEAINKIYEIINYEYDFYDDIAKIKDDIQNILSEVK